MATMKDFEIRIRNGGDDAVAAMAELWETREKILFDITDAFTRARWIPVTERLPDLEDEDGETPNVLGYYSDYPPDIQLVWYTGNGWEDGDGSGRDVKAPTHWMPLPAPPTDGK